MNKNNKNILIGLLGIAWLTIGIVAFSFVVTAGLTYLIFWCFGWEWNWLIALGIWLLMILLRNIFGGNK